MKTLKRLGHLSLVALVMAFGLVFSFDNAAEAQGRRGVISQDYQFDGPKHGYDGRATGGAYCSYQRIPNRKCKIVNGVEKCKVKGWTLRQYCY